MDDTERKLIVAHHLELIKQKFNVDPVVINRKREKVQARNVRKIFQTKLSGQLAKTRDALSLGGNSCFESQMSRDNPGLLSTKNQESNMVFARAMNKTCMSVKTSGS